jgi:hypothetical protein
MTLRLAIRVGGFLFIEIAASRFAEGIHDSLIPSWIHDLLDKDAVCYPEFVFLIDMR